MAIKSKNVSWLEISGVLFSYEPKGLIDSFYNAQEIAIKAKNAIAGVPGITELPLYITKADIEALNLRRRKLIYFANGIHYEINEKVDNPFALLMGDTAQSALELNPSSIQIGESGNGAEVLESLITLIMDIIDKALADDFLEKATYLDEDTSIELSEAIAVAQFWQREFELSDACQRVVDEFLSDELCKSWETMTQQERMDALEGLKQEISIVLGDGVDIVFKSLLFDAKNYGGAHGGKNAITINPQFVTDGTGNYSLDKAVDSILHEMRHQYQWEIRTNPDFDVPQSVVVDFDHATVSSGKNKKNFTGYYTQLREEDAKAFAALSRPREKEE